MEIQSKHAYKACFQIRGRLIVIKNKTATLTVKINLLFFNNLFSAEDADIL